MHTNCLAGATRPAGRTLWHRLVVSHAGGDGCRRFHGERFDPAANRQKGKNQNDQYCRNAADGTHSSKYRAAFATSEVPVSSLSFSQFSFPEKLMFLISKLIGFVLSPSNLIGLLALFGVLLMLVKRRRVGVVVLVVAASLLAVGGWSPAGPALLLALEDRFPKAQIDDEQVAGIILLGGAVNTHISADRGQPALNDAGERVTAAAELARRFPDARVLLSGGASDLTLGEPVTESAVARDILIGLGIVPQRIELEENSRNTCENAEQSLLLAKPRSGELWLLVTSASHMPRAMACFRAAGFAVLPYPVDFRSRRADSREPTASIAIGLQALDLAAHEWIGLISYRLLGRTDELLPAP